MLIKITAEHILKRFDKTIVFKDISFSLSTPASLAVTGDNGTGKSTLLEIVAGIQKPSSGKMIYESDGIGINLIQLQDNMGFSSPKINPYGELTALENLQFVFTKTDDKSINNCTEQLKDILDKFDLYNESNKQVKYLSSGMKQRLRLMFAIVNDPHIIILDEPGSNLDVRGKELIYKYIDTVKNQKIIIVATNQNEEARLCDVKINLGQQCFKKSTEGFSS